MTHIPQRYYYPNAALSTAALRDWSESVARLSSRFDEDPARILSERTAKWGSHK